MENTLNEILVKLNKMDSKIDTMESKLENVESKLENVESKLENVEADIKDLKKLKPMVKELYDLKPKFEESHLWLSTLIENKEVQKAEMDSLKLDVATTTGILKGFDNSLELLKKAE